MNTGLKVVAVFAIFVLACSAQHVEAIPNLLWSRQFGKDKFEHRFPQAIPARDQLFVAVRVHPADSAEKPWASAVWHIDPTGALSNVVEIPNPEAHSTDDGVGVTSLSVLDNGDVTGVFEVADGLPALFRFSGQRLVVPPAEKLPLGKNLRIFKVLQTNDNNLALAGTHASKAYVMKVTQDGQKVWERTLPSDATGAIFDGMATDDGGLLLVGDFWNGDPFFIGKSSIWVGRIDAHGAIQGESTFTGRRPRMASAGKNGFAVLYDDSDSVAQSIRLRTFTLTLENVGNSEIYHVDRGVATFRIAPISAGGFVVVGSDDLKLVVSRLSPDARSVWTVVDPQIQAPDFELVSAGNRFFVVYPRVSIFMADGKRELNSKVGVIAFICQ